MISESSRWRIDWNLRGGRTWFDMQRLCCELARLGGSLVMDTAADSIHVVQLVRARWRLGCSLLVSGRARPVCTHGLRGVPVAPGGSGRFLSDDRTHGPRTTGGER